MAKIKVENTEILFGDLDLSSFDAYMKQIPNEDESDNK